MARTPTPTTHHVAIVNDHSQHRVVPGQLVAGGGDLVVFHSVAAGAVRLMFPTPIVADSATGKPLKRLLLAAGGSARATVIGGEAARPGSYTYLVYCEEVDELALGGSQPKIIIYK
jgi:hypothetical protein